MWFNNIENRQYNMTLTVKTKSKINLFTETVFEPVGPDLLGGMLK